MVCFDEADLRWAKAIAGRFPDVPLYLSAGTPVRRPPDLRDAVGAALPLALRKRWPAIRTSADARVLPQLHVIAWGDATGV